MGQDHGTTGQELVDDQQRTPEQVREEIEHTRIELGDTDHVDSRGGTQHAVGARQRLARKP